MAEVRRRGFAMIPCAACAVAASASIAACFGSTEIRLEITSNASCHDLQTGDTQLFVSSADHQSDVPVTETHDCRDADGHSTIGSLVLVPSGDRAAKLSIEIVTSLGKAPRDCTPGHLDGCIVARRRLNFRRHEQVALPIEMRVECLGVACAESETCVLGTCHPADTAASLFCNEATCDAGSPLPSDAGEDGDGSSIVLDASADSMLPEASAPLPCPGAETAPLRISVGVGTTSYNLFGTATDLYWVDTVAGDIWSLPKAGGAPTHWATGEDTPSYVVRDAKTVYWTAAAGLRIEATPNTPSTAFVLGAGNGGGAMVAGNGGVYWFASDTNQILFTQMVGASMTTHAVTSGANISPYDIAFDGTSLYWSNRGAVSGILRVAATGNGQAPQLFAAASSPVGITTSPTHVYWTDTGSVMARPKNQSTASVTLATRQDNPGGIAVADTDVYFANLGLSPTFAGNVAHVSTAGGPVTKIASGRSPTVIIADARCVYWIQRDVKEVWKSSR
jgi:hypothetical protein